MREIYEDIKDINNDISLHNDVDKIKDLVKIMNSDEIRKDIEKYTTTDEVNEEEIFLLTIAAQLIYEYSGGESTGMSDTEYDILFEEVMNEFKMKMNITQPIVSTGKVVHHKFKTLRGTLDKIYYLDSDETSANKSRKGLPEWIASSERKIFDRTGRHVDLNDEWVYIFPKFDGLSCILEGKPNGDVDRALTRGFTETNEAQDVTHIFKDLVKLPESDKPLGLKCEIMMSQENFEKYNKKYGTDYKNSRSAVASIMNSKEADDRIYLLDPIPLRISYLENGEESLQEVAPKAFNYPYIKCKLNETDKIRKFAEDHHYVGKEQYRCDGAVIYIINRDIQNILGREDNKQKFEVAYKFTEVSTYSKIKDIKFTIGLFGKINPIAVVEPVKLKGNTIENISLGSMGRFSTLHLAKGDKVKVLYDIIPYLVYDEDDGCKRSGNKPIEGPTHCPECGDILEKVEDSNELFCENKKCPCRIKGKILNYFNKMHIDDISYATVDRFFEEGYLKNIKDVYKLHKYKKELCELSGFGKKSINLILNEIDANRHCTYSQMLGALGITSVSEKTFDKILKMFNFDDIMDLALNDNMMAFTVIPGIREKTAQKIVDGIKENEKLILYLEEELDLYQEMKEAKFKIGFTKVRDEELERWIKSKGGEPSDTVTKDTDLLIIPMSGVESGKTEKARKYGIPIVQISEAKDYITDNIL